MFLVESCFVSPTLALVFLKTKHNKHVQTRRKQNKNKGEHAPQGKRHNFSTKLFESKHVGLFFDKTRLPWIRLRKMCLVEACSVSPSLALCSDHMCLGEACFVAPTLVLCFDIDSRAALRTSQPPFGEIHSEWKTISNGPAQ